MSAFTSSAYIHLHFRLLCEEIMNIDFDKETTNNFIS